jgi:hypothetical protein
MMMASGDISFVATVSFYLHRRVTLSILYQYLVVFNLSYSSLEGLAVAQLVEVLRYKSEGRGFDFRLCHWNFSLKLSFRPHYGSTVDSASNRNEYQESFLGLKAAGA